MQPGVIVNERQPNKYYRCVDTNVAAGSYLDIDIDTLLSIPANTVSITNDSLNQVDIVLNDEDYDRIPLYGYAELSWKRDELQVSWVRIYNNGSETARIVLLATG